MEPIVSPMSSDGWIFDEGSGDAVVVEESVSDSWIFRQSTSVLSGIPVKFIVWVCTPLEIMHKTMVIGIVGERMEERCHLKRRKGKKKNGVT